MTEQERTLYTYIIRVLHRHSKYSRLVEISSPQNKFLSAEEILAILKEDAKTAPALQAYLDQKPALSPSDLDQFLSTVLDLEYPKAVNQNYFYCNEENSEGKTLKRCFSSDEVAQYAIPKKKEVSAYKNFESNDLLVLLGILLTKPHDEKVKISDLKKTIRELAGEHALSTQTITKIAKKLCLDENVEKLGFKINYNMDERTRPNEELTFTVKKLFDPFEASMLADMLKTFPYYSADIANRLIEKLQFFDEDGVYSFPDEEKSTIHKPTTYIPPLIDSSIRGSFRLNEEECEKFLEHITQLKKMIKKKHKILMTYGERVIDPNNDRAQILRVREERTMIHPHELVWANGYYYFVATPEDANKKPEKYAHNYRVDRIIELIDLDDDEEYKDLPESEKRAEPIKDDAKHFSNVTVITSPLWPTVVPTT